jgi:bacterioferritin-associated ferredoxin
VTLVYICICNAITDRQIRAAVAAGASSLGEVSMQLGVGAGCGSCREAAQHVIRDAACGGDCATCAQHEAAT